MVAPPRLPNANADNPSMKSRDPQTHDPAFFQNRRARDLVPVI